MTLYTIGMAGLGRMGEAMAHRLIDKGFLPLLWNRSPISAELRDRGARVVATPSDLIRETKIIITSLLNDAALDAVYLGAHGLLCNDLQGHVLIDTSTVMPETIHRISAEAERRGGHLIDSPVLGTMTPARKGQLIAMAGGTAAAMEIARPVLELLARRVEHIGPSGSGSAMKLALNLPIAVYWAAMSDCLALAALHGVNRDRLLGIIADSPAALAQLPLKMDILQGRSTEVAFPLSAVLKDMGLMRRSAEPHLRLLTVEVAEQIYRQALEVGDRDVAAVALVAADRMAAEGHESI
jgi:3-hydroxyisobutyrate dehydrogenase